MNTRYFFATIVASALLIGSAVAQDDTYRPGEFLTLNVSQAALSPKPLGPPAQFEAVKIEAKADAEMKVEATRVEPAVPRQAARVKPRSVPSRKVARVRSNPLDANASDTRVQVWPCRSGGICNWKR